ncbi:MAG: hypothetical protein AAF490_32130 [Chloroflexota bacterium]
MIEIRKHGNVLKTDENGYLISDASLEKIIPPWDMAVSFIKDAYIKHLGQQLHSVYIRGSVARGLAVEGLSDLDSLAFLHGFPPQERENLDWANQVSKQYLERFPFSDRPEMQIKWIGPLLDNLEDKGISLKLEYVCVHGKDIIPQIPPVKIKALVKNSAFGSDYISRIVQQVHDKVEGDVEAEQITSKCRWICKRFLRAGLSLVMSRANVFTRDLYYCYELFSKFYPQQEPAMLKALQLALNPTDNVNELIPFIDEFGEFLALEADAIFGL